MTDLISEEKSKQSRIRRNEEKQKAIESASKVDLPDKNPCIAVSTVCLQTWIMAWGIQMGFHFIDCDTSNLKNIANSF